MRENKDILRATPLMLCLLLVGVLLFSGCKRDGLESPDREDGAQAPAEMVDASSGSAADAGIGVEKGNMKRDGAGERSKERDAIDRVKSATTEGGSKVVTFFKRLTSRARAKGDRISLPEWKASCEGAWCRVTLTFDVNDRMRRARWLVGRLVRPQNKLAAMLMQKGKDWSAPTSASGVGPRRRDAKKR